MKLKTGVLLLSIFLILSIEINSSERVIVSGLGRPVGINIDNEQLYIIENHKIHIYSLRDIKHKNSFGKQGQGPGEFHTLPHVPVTLDCSTNELIVGSIRKISYFTKSGELIREVKGKSLAYKLVYLDRKDGEDRFLGWSRAVHDKFNYNTIVVFNHELNKVKQLYEAKDPYQGAGKGYDILTRVFDFISHKGRIIIPGRDNRSLDVLNNKLNPVFTLIPETGPVSVPESFKQELLHYLKTSAETKNSYPLIKPVRFPKYFPSVQSFFANSGIIVIMTWERSETGNKFLIYTMNGELKSETNIPVKYETSTQPYPMAVRNGKFYQLVEDYESEEWELIVRKIL